MFKSDFYEITHKKIEIQALSDSFLDFKYLVKNLPFLFFVKNLPFLFFSPRGKVATYIQKWN